MPKTKLMMTKRLRNMDHCGLLARGVNENRRVVWMESVVNLLMFIVITSFVLVHNLFG